MNFRILEFLNNQLDWPGLSRIPVLCGSPLPGNDENYVYADANNDVDNGVGTDLDIDND